MPTTTTTRHSNERGIAMITTLLVLMLMSALLVGFTTVVMSDARYRFIDRDRGQAFYAASAGIEKLTADLGNLFLQNVAPTQAQVTALTLAARMPVISGITFVAPQAPDALPASQLTSYHCSGRDALGNLLVPPTKTPDAPIGTTGYQIRMCQLILTGNPTTSDDNLVISGTGAYAGMTALQTPYQIDVTAKTSTGGEVHLSRTIQAVAIPVFQFMMFSESDQSLFAGSAFNFGGRVHTNGNLWMAAGTGATTTTTGRFTAFKDVVTQYLSNGSSIDVSGHVGTVTMATSAAAPAGNRTLARTDGSVLGLPGSAGNPSWQTISLGSGPANYNGFLRNGPTGLSPGTGAKRLTLPLTAPGVGGTNVDIVRRPPVGEDVTGILYNERLYTKTSIRILLSDTSADIMNTPGVTATLPIQLTGDWRAAAPFAGYASLPIARSMGNTGTLTTLSANVAQPVAPALATIPVVVTPAMFQKPVLYVKNGAGVQAGPIICTAWTETTFTGCNVAVALLAGWTVYVNPQPAPPSVNPGVGTMPGDTALRTVTIAAAVAAGNPKTITLTAGQTTLNFAANSFFVNDIGGGGTGVSTWVTCAGATLTSLTGCSNVPPLGFRNGATISTGYAAAVNAPTIGGWIKIEKSSNAVPTVWTDVTQEILKYGIGGPNSNGTCNPSPTAIVQIQRARDGYSATLPAAGGPFCAAGDLTNSYEYWPNVLFDTREGLQRNADPGTLPGAVGGLEMGGAISYIRIDAKNLAMWFRGQAPYNLGTGNTSRTDTSATGYSVYFSDRRSNRNAAGAETAEYGYEDFVNPGVANGLPNAICNLPGEDVNESGACDTYGKTPTYDGVVNSVGALLAPYAAANKPETLIKPSYLRVNRPIFFRRALMMSNGATLGSDPVAANRITGLTIVSENPVYIQGDWNAAPTFAVADLHSATAVIADAVTLLSSRWDDSVSFQSPYGAATRARPANSYYRVAVLGGKGPSFSIPADEAVMLDFGTDGGAHNFLRMLEGGAGALNYRGSMATLFYNRQAVGTYKCCNTVYGPPTRNFIFDTDFTNPALLPPLTPMFRDMNVIGFSQELRPGK